MKCLRCEGMMVREWAVTLGGRTWMARCLHCGNLIDAVIVFNRNRSPVRFPRVKGVKIRAAS